MHQVVSKKSSLAISLDYLHVIDMASTTKIPSIQVTFPNPHVAHIQLPCSPQTHTLLVSEWVNLKSLFQTFSNDKNVHVVVLSGSLVGDGGDFIPEKSHRVTWDDEQQQQVRYSRQRCIATIVACVKREFPSIITAKYEDELTALMDCFSQQSCNSRQSRLFTLALGPRISLRMRYTYFLLTCQFCSSGRRRRHQCGRFNPPPPTAETRRQQQLDQRRRAEWEGIWSLGSITCGPAE